MLSSLGQSTMAVFPMDTKKYTARLCHFFANEMKRESSGLTLSFLAVLPNHISVFFWGEKVVYKKSNIWLQNLSLSLVGFVQA